MAAVDWDGTSSDLAGRFYALAQQQQQQPAAAGANATLIAPMPFDHADLPAGLQRRLGIHGLRFEQLSPLLQRAVVWDSGYVLGAGQELLRVYTRENRTMAELAVSLEAYRHAGCAARNCSDVGSYRSQYCSGTQMLGITRCATEDVQGKLVHLSMWATGGGPASAVPEFGLYRHQWIDKDGTYLVYAIHTVSDTRQPPWGSCPTTSAGETSAMIIPCRPYRLLTAADGVWTPPPETALVASWLRATQEQLLATATPRPTEPTTTSDKSGPTATTAWWILGIVLGGVFVLAIMWWWCRSRRRRGAAGQSRRRPRAQQRRYLKHDDDGEDVDFGTPKHPESQATYESTATPTTTSETRGRDDDGFDSVVIQKNDVLRTLLTDPVLKDKRLVFEKLAFERILAKGAFGEVWLATYDQSMLVAVKRVLKDKRPKFQDLADFTTEIQLTASLQHPHVIGFIGVAWNSLENLCLVTEYMANGDLQGFLRENESKLAGHWTSDKTRVALGVARALVFLHSHSEPLIHRDLKAKNVLLTQELNARVMDFGVSRRRQVDYTMTAGVGTPYWTAPEILEGVQYTESSDIYSFGVLLSELETCKLPYHERTRQLKTDGRHGDNLIPQSPADLERSDGSSSLATEALRPFQILKMVMNGTLRPSFTPNCPAWLRELAVRCLNADPGKRPTARQLVDLLIQE